VEKTIARSCGKKVWVFFEIVQRFLLEINGQLSGKFANKNILNFLRFYGRFAE